MCARILLVLSFVCFAVSPVAAFEHTSVDNNTGRGGTTGSDERAHRIPDVVELQDKYAIAERPARLREVSPATLGKTRYTLDELVVSADWVVRDGVLVSAGRVDRTEAIPSRHTSVDDSFIVQHAGNGNDDSDTTLAGELPDISIEVENSGGAPLLLTIAVRIDPYKQDTDEQDNDKEATDKEDTEAEPRSTPISQVLVRSGRSAFALDAPEKTEFEVQVSPFQEPGTYELDVLLIDDERRVVARELFDVGFVDFRYGRDNFSFGNDSDTSLGDVKPYSDTLREWLEERFALEDPDPVTETLILSESYRIFKGSVGRCYAFAASKERYFRFPDTRPQWYDNVYDIRERALPHQREMNRLQNDIVFDHFVLGDRDAYREQSAGEAGDEVRNVRERIDDGVPATVTYLTPDRHHAMLVYGYIQRQGADTIDLIAANNWGRENEQNLQSEDAEVIRVDLASGQASWVDAPVRAYDDANKFFVVDVNENTEDYGFVEADIAAFVERRVSEARESGEAILVVEKVDGAVLVNPEGLRTGRLGRRNYDEFDEVAVRTVGNNVLFTFSPDLELELTLEGLEPDKDDRDTDGPDSQARDAHVYSFTPADADDVSRAVVSRDVRLSLDTERTFQVSNGLVRFED